MVVGGKKLNNTQKHNYQVVNVYGPAEYTVATTKFAVDKAYDNIPISCPLANTWLYVLDKGKQLLPLGVPGELYITGKQIARGYLNRPDLTEERFTPNPYKTGEVNSKLYRTGDLVRWLSD